MQGPQEDGKKNPRSKETERKRKEVLYGQDRRAGFVQSNTFQSTVCVLYVLYVLCGSICLFTRNRVEERAKRDTRFFSISPRANSIISPLLFLSRRTTFSSFSLVTFYFFKLENNHVGAQHVERQATQYTAEMEFFFLFSSLSSSSSSSILLTFKTNNKE